MTSEEFRECFSTIGWNYREMARRVGWNEATIRRWHAGSHPVPQDVARWVQKIADAIARTPAPGKGKIDHRMKDKPT